ncbi:hypothetical protein J6590_039714 [Homalodisca vitripennis]|nr:hypothetical protein J6590_039714 [Homalodisca vitripennis]
MDVHLLSTFLGNPIALVQEEKEGPVIFLGGLEGTPQLTTPLSSRIHMVLVTHETTRTGTCRRVVITQSADPGGVINGYHTTQEAASRGPVSGLTGGLAPALLDHLPPGYSSRPIYLFRSAHCALFGQQLSGVSCTTSH